jgi:hypothetical protein
MEICDCSFCHAYDRYRWAIIMACACSCHDGDGAEGHDGLCCEFPNGLRKNNPHENLKPAEFYRKDLVLE